MGKPLIFIHPLRESLLKLKEEMEKEDEIDVYEVDTLDEVNQLYQTVCPAGVLTSDVKKTAKFLAMNKRSIRDTSSRVVLLNDKGLSIKGSRKMSQLGLSDHIVEPIPPKSLYYKINLMMRSLPKRKAKDDEKAEVKKLSSGEEEVSTDEKLRVEKGIMMEGATNFDDKTKKKAEPGLSFEQAPEEEKEKKNYTDHINDLLKSKKKSVDIDLFDKEKEKGYYEGKGGAVDDLDSYYDQKKKKSSDTEMDIDYGEKKKNQGYVEDLDDITHTKKSEEQKLEFEKEKAESKEKSDNEKLKNDNLELKKHEGLEALEFEKEERNSTEEMYDPLGKNNAGKFKDDINLDLEEEEKKKKRQIDKLNFSEDNEKPLEELDQISAELEKKKKSLETLELDMDQNKVAAEKVEEEKKKKDKEREEEELSLKFDEDKKNSEEEEELETEEEKKKKKEMKTVSLDFDESEKEKAEASKKEQEKKKKAELEELDLEAEKAKKKKDEISLSFDENAKNIDEDEVNVDHDYDKKKKANETSLQFEDEQKEKEDEKNKIEEQGYRQEKMMSLETQEFEKEKKEKEKEKGIDNYMRSKASKNLDLGIVDENGKRVGTDHISTYYGKNPRLARKNEFDESWDFERNKNRTKELEKAGKRGEDSEFSLEKKNLGEQTIDYDKIHKEFDANVDRTQKRRRKRKGKRADVDFDESEYAPGQYGDDEEDENSEFSGSAAEGADAKENDVFEVDSMGIEYSVYMQNQYQKQKQDASQVFKLASNVIRNKKNGHTTFFTKENDKFKITFTTQYDLENKDPKDPKKLAFDEIIEKHAERWKEVSVPGWKDETFRDEENDFVFPYFEGITQLGMAVINFEEPLKLSEKDGPFIENLCESVRAIYLQERAEKGGQKIYASSNASSSEVSDATGEQDNSDKKEKTGFFKKLFGKAS